jgi:capsular polysaccharide biosynthesis protein
VVTHAPLDFDALVCRSVIKAPQAAPAQVEEVLFDGVGCAVTTVDDVLYLPELRLQVIEDRVVPEEAIRDPRNFEFEQRNSWHGGGGRFRASFDVREVDETVCILSNLYTHNFTHWLEELLKVTILERAGYAGRYVLSSLPPSMPPFASEFLRLLGIPGERIDDAREPTVFRSAVYTTAIHFDSLDVCPGAFLALRAALLASVADVRSPYAARLWLDRGPNVERSGRDLVNPDEVHACVERRGFERVDMGSLPLERQLAAARDAAVIAGAHGSAFAHCMFMKERSTVIECFSPLYLNGASFGICRVLDHRYLLVVDSNSQYFPYPHGNRVHVPLDQLELAFRHLE